MPRNTLPVPEINNQTLYEMIVRCDSLPLRRLNAQQRGMVIHFVQNNMSEFVREIDRMWFHLGMFWSFVVKNRLYRHWGEHIRNANDLAKELNLGVSRSMLDHYARVYATFGKYLRSPEREGMLIPPIRRLLQANTLITNGSFDTPEARDAAVAEWTEKASSLGTEAFENEIREAQGRITTDACGHPAEQSQLWSRCGCCGKWLEMMPNIHEEISKGAETAVPIPYAEENTTRRVNNPGLHTQWRTERLYEQMQQGQAFRPTREQLDILERLQRDQYEEIQRQQQRPYEAQRPPILTDRERAEVIGALRLHRPGTSANAMTTAAPARNLREGSIGELTDWVLGGPQERGR